MWHALTRGRAEHDEHGLWDERGWIGGYEMGISFLSDWVGNFVYDLLLPEGSGRPDAPNRFPLAKRMFWSLFIPSSASNSLGA